MRHPCATIADALEALLLATQHEVATDARAQSEMAPNEFANWLGWVDAKNDTITRLRAWIDHLRLVATQRFPWCDTCKLPAVSSEFLGKMHLVPGNQHGLHPELDKLGHAVTMREWYDISSSELTS